MTRVSAYSQVVVKVGVERSYLIDRRTLQNLAECKSSEELISRLKRSIYRSVLKGIETPSAEELQYSLKEELIRLYRRMVDYSPEEIRSFLKDYISKLEIENLKALLRGKNVGVSQRTLVKRLHLSVEDIFGRTGSTKFFDFSLDRAYYENLLNSAEAVPWVDREIASSFAGTEVDLFNIVTIIRSKFLGYPSHSIYRMVTHRFYKLTESQIRTLISSESLDSVLNAIKKGYYGKFLPTLGRLEETLIKFKMAIKNFTSSAFLVFLRFGRTSISTYSCLYLYGWKAVPVPS
ncbi:hypothetical protein B6U84_02900 [Candidatus Bathyarchaeota archaeon ex4484_40]|nr:MAG: hypothetical protein B6U84_02900 [Candidatus Bathyarchaeota archaeon ex4484_40]